MMNLLHPFCNDRVEFFVGAVFPGYGYEQWLPEELCGGVLVTGPAVAVALLSHVHRQDQSVGIIACCHGNLVSVNIQKSSG